MTQKPRPRSESSAESGVRVSPVPTGRVGRLWALGSVASRMAVSGLAEGARRMRGGASETTVGSAFLTVSNARMLADRLSRLRGAAMKLGQMLSMEGDHLLPREFAEALSKLRAEADVMPGEQVASVMSEAYGPDYREVFVGFDGAPMASASIGQVHRGRLASGADVVVKIQYPGVADSVESDVDNLASLLGVARLLPGQIDVKAMTDELKRQLREEADYLREAEQAAAFAQHVAKVAGVSVPGVHLELATPRTLVLDYEGAPPLFPWAQEHATQAQRNQLAARLIELTLRELFQFGLVQTDPNFANYLYRPESDEIVLLDFGAVRPVELEVAAGYHELLSAALHDDHPRMERALIQAGYLRATDAAHARTLLTEVVMTCAEMLRQPGAYDFEQSSLIERVKTRAGDMLKLHNEVQSPPPTLMFFQRKIAGTYLMCKRLNARVDCHALCSRLLTELPTPTPDTPPP